MQFKASYEMWQVSSGELLLSMCVLKGHMLLYHLYIKTVFSLAFNVVKIPLCLNPDITKV